MKTLKKLQIDSGKLIKKEELIYFQGGSWSGTCEVICPYGYFNGPASGTNCYTAQLICEGMWDDCDCNCGCK